MEYDKLLKSIGEFGRYQLIFIILLSLSTLFNGLTTFAPNFIFGEHKHRCQIPSMVEDHFVHTGSAFSNETDDNYNVTECFIEINGTTEECSNWVYDQSIYTETITSKFDVVCSRKFYRAYYLTSSYVGLLVGSIIGGIVCDTFGRKPSLFVGIVLMAVAEGVRPFLPSFKLVVVMEFVNGVGGMLAYIAPVITVTELVGPKKRLLANFIFYMHFCISLYTLLLIAYIFRHWDHVMLTITAMMCLYIIVVLYVPESPRWLLSRGRKGEAFTIMNKIAKMNKKECVNIEEDILIENEVHVPFPQFIKTVIRSRTLLIRICIVCINWFAINMTYFGLAMNIGKLSGDIFVNFAISTTAETLSIVMCFFLVDRVGHKRFYAIAMISAGVACISTMFTSMFGGNSLNWLTTTLAVTGRFFISACFFLVYLYTAELFPTVLRATVLGLSSMIGRIGTIVSAYVGELGSVIHTKFGAALPILIFGTLGLVAGLLTIFLPDTTNISLPESVQDAKLIAKTDRTRNGDGHEHELDTLKQMEDK